MQDVEQRSMARLEGISSAGRAPALQAGSTVRSRYPPPRSQAETSVKQTCLTLAFEKSNATLFNKTEEGLVTRADEALGDAL
ncbi:MAG: hypothetical protein IPJ50_10320 [Betaproteobacteria bacterium]|nr:hypothetical protein [Betaproteobacteria bacterium]